MLGLDKLGSKKKIIFITIIILLIGGCGYLVYANFISNKTAENANVTTANTNTTGLPQVITKFNQEIFTAPQMVDLKSYGEKGFTKQYETMATDKNTPFELVNVRVVDPGVGARLYLFWELPSVINFSKISIYRSTNMGSGQELITELTRDPSTSIFPTFYQDDNLGNDTTYYYLLKTVNDNMIQSENTEQTASMPTDIFAPPPPRNVQIKDMGDKASIKIAWIDPEDPDFDFVRIYRSTQKGKLGMTIKDKTPGEDCYPEFGKDYYCFIDHVSAGITYYYTLTSLDKAGNESTRRILTNPPRSNPFEQILF